jgi:hypothetical protein
MAASKNNQNIRRYILENIVTYTRCGSVTNKTTWFELDTGFIRHGDLQLQMVTITMSTIALVASRIPLKELNCTVSLRGFTDEDRLRRPSDVD